MKNIIKLFGIIALSVVIGFTMVACNKGSGGSSGSGSSSSGGGGSSSKGGIPNGTYIQDEYGMIQFTFSGNKATMSLVEDPSSKQETTYEIKDGKIQFFDEDGKPADSHDIKIDGKKITMGGHSYTRK